MHDHDDVIKWKHFPRYWAFMRGIHRSPVNSPHKGQWRGALMFSLICVWINGWVNNREPVDLRRYRVHYDVTVMIAWKIYIKSHVCRQRFPDINQQGFKTSDWLVLRSAASQKSGFQIRVDHHGFQHDCLSETDSKSDEWAKKLRPLHGKVYVYIKYMKHKVEDFSAKSRYERQGQVITPYRDSVRLEATNEATELMHFLFLQITKFLLRCESE